MNNNKFCVFCGNPPEDKNKEHIVPQWLLKLTGDPKRIVDFGTNYQTGKTVRFDWKNFTVPSCSSCNLEYSDLEARAKKYTLTILKRGALTSIEYSDFMDWLDKVRVGVWIAYHFIQGNPTDIDLNFHIKSRIGQKDRMIAIYPIAGDGVGLNLFGVESLVFHRQPSCFALRINNILILNMSSDYLFAGRVGFPYPESSFMQLDGENAGMVHVSSFSSTNRLKHPLIRKIIFKPSVHLYQPIMAKENDTMKSQAGYFGGHSACASHLALHTIPPYFTGKGKLFFQYLDRVEPIYELDQAIEFQSITGIHAKPMVELVKQVYEFQNYIYEMSKYKANDQDILKTHSDFIKLLLKRNKDIISRLSAEDFIRKKDS